MRLRDALKDEDNQYDLGFMQWFVGTLVFLGSSVYVTYTKGTFDPSSFGLGFGAVLAAGGAMSWLRATKTTTTTVTPPTATTTETVGK